MGAARSSAARSSPDACITRLVGTRELPARSSAASLLAEACALYEVVYEEKQRAALGQEEPKYFTTFPWHVCGDMLLFVRKARVSRAINPSQALFSSLGTRGWE